jgi:hypothetical protein
MDNDLQRDVTKWLQRAYTVEALCAMLHAGAEGKLQKTSRPV